MFRRIALPTVLAVGLALAAPAAADEMTLDDVVRLLEAGIGERVVIAQIMDAGTDFSLSPDQILDLKERGVPDSVIEALILAGDPVENEFDVEVEGESAVPADVGFSRYDDPEAVEVALVPYAVPRYVYVDDPWRWSFSWYDPYYYASYYHHVPYYYSSWSSPWYSPGIYVSWYYGHNHYGNHHNNYHHHYDHDYGYAQGDRHESIYRPSYVKRNYRNAGMTTSSRSRLTSSSGTKASSRYARRSDGTVKSRSSGTKISRTRARSTGTKSTVRSGTNRAPTSRSTTIKRSRPSSGGSSISSGNSAPRSRAPASGGSSRSSGRSSRASGGKSRR